MIVLEKNGTSTNIDHDDRHTPIDYIGGSYFLKTLPAVPHSALKEQAAVLPWLY
jgi:hypothetical protein